MIVIQDAPEIIGYVERVLGIRISQPSIALGFMRDDGRPMSAAILNDYSGANIELTLVAERHGVTRDMLNYLGRYIFGKLSCRRLTVRTKKRNKRVLRIFHDTRHGFEFECVAKDFYADDDAVVFRMRKAKCRWIPDEIT